MRHRVGAEKGSGAMALSGLLGLRTSCASRSQALSGSASKTDLWMVTVAAVMQDAIGVLGVEGLCDTSRFLKRKPEFVLTAFNCQYPIAGHPGLPARQPGLFASSRGIL